MNHSFEHNGVTYYITTEAQLGATHKDIPGSILDNLFSALNTTKQISVEKLKWGDFVSMWNEYAEKNQWRRILATNRAIQSSFNLATKDFPTLPEWKTILDGVVADKFFGSIEMKASILFTKKRYFEFYEGGLACTQTSHQDRVLSNLKGIIDGIC